MIPAREEVEEARDFFKGWKDGEIRDTLDVIRHRDTLQALATALLEGKVGELISEEEIVEHLKSFNFTDMISGKMVVVEGKAYFKVAPESVEQIAHALVGHVGKKIDIFIKHIQGHLKPDEFVICKICGKSAEEIINGKV